MKDISIQIGSGITPSRMNGKYWENGTIPWLKTEQLDEHEIYETSEHITEQALKETSIKIFPVNTLSIAMYGEGKTRGNVAILKTPMTTNQACCNIVINEEKANYKYVYYFLKTQYNQLRSLSSGVRKNLNSNDIKEFEVRLPDITTQQQIASVLSSLDSKIELNNRINRELEQMAKLLYDYWFVQFEFPYSPPSEGCPQDGVVGKPYKSSGGKMVWNEELKREMPEGWKVVKMEEVLVIKNGRDHKHLELGFIPVYGSGGIMRFANESIYDSESILIPRKGTLGNLFYINTPFWCIDTIFYTIMKFSHSCKYLFYTIRAFNISSMNTGTAVPSMTTGILNNLALVFPPFETLKAFDSIVSPIFQKKEYIAKENQQLASFRDWLLPMLMNGQVTVGAKEKVSYEVKEGMDVAAEPNDNK